MKSKLSLVSILEAVITPKELEDFSRGLEDDENTYQAPSKLSLPQPVENDDPPFMDDKALKTQVKGKQSDQVVNLRNLAQKYNIDPKIVLQIANSPKDKEGYILVDAPTYNHLLNKGVDIEEFAQSLQNAAPNYTGGDNRYLGIKKSGTGIPGNIQQMNAAGNQRMLQQKPTGHISQMNIQPGVGQASWDDLNQYGSELRQNSAAYTQSNQASYEKTKPGRKIVKRGANG